MRLLPHEVAIGVLAGEFDGKDFPDPQTAFDGKAGALRFLCRLTGENFGLNAENWRGWFGECDSDTIHRCYESLNYENSISN